MKFCSALISPKSVAQGTPNLEIFSVQGEGMRLQNEQAGRYLGGFADNPLSKGLGRTEGALYFPRE